MAQSTYGKNLERVVAELYEVSTEMEQSGQFVFTNRAWVYTDEEGKVLIERYEHALKELAALGVKVPHKTFLRSDGVPIDTLLTSQPQDKTVFRQMLEDTGRNLPIVIAQELDHIREMFRDGNFEIPTIDCTSWVQGYYRLVDACREPLKNEVLSQPSFKHQVREGVVDVYRPLSLGEVMSLMACRQNYTPSKSSGVGYHTCSAAVYGKKYFKDWVNRIIILIHGRLRKTKF